MTTPSWIRIEEVFQAAFEVPDAERGAFLDDACEGDRELRSEVDSLLGSSPRAAPRIRDAIGLAAERLLAADSIPFEGRRLGAYRLSAELGRGGMGIVYLAERADDAYRTRVAIKVLHRGLEAGQAVARFRDERQILASLEHPGIVRLLDGGAAEDGSPYFVMEHVEGEPIIRWATARQLDVRARVAIFREVCRAVAYAHQKLVVHRDIKPSNLLVTSDGKPKLLDFGIAKLLAKDPGLEAHTRTGMQLLTPEYASPEQIRGDPASTATDVYSLGAVLYELLSGVMARRLDKPGGDAIHSMLEREPPLPSSVSAPALSRALTGDLDNVVQKAMHKDLEQRYASVEQLSEDLGRYLDGLPVAARPATLGYRAVKFVRRNRALLGGAAIVVASLCTATVVSMRQAHRADEQARRADEQARRAERRFEDVRRLTNSLLFEIDEKIRPLEGATSAREVIVRRALEYLDGLSRETGEDAALARELAAAYMKIGDIQGNIRVPNLGRPEDGLESYEKARAILRHLAASGHDDSGTQWALARALYGLGDLAHSTRRFALAREKLLAATEIALSLPEDEEFDYEHVVLGYVALAEIESEDEGDLGAAMKYAERCRATAAAWAKVSDAPDTQYWLGIANELRAHELSLAADPDAAVISYREASVAVEALVDRYPQNLAYRRELATSEELVATSLSGIGDGTLWTANIGDIASAEVAMKRAVALLEPVHEHDPDDARAGPEAANAVGTLAATVAVRSPEAAAPLFRQALSAFAALPPSAKTSSYNREVEPFTHCLAGALFANDGERAVAKSEIEEGLSGAARSDKKEALTLSDKVERLVCVNEAAKAELALGDTAAAEKHLDEEGAAFRELIAKEPATIAPYLGLTEVLELSAKLKPAERCTLLQGAVETWRSWRGTATPYTRRRGAELEAALGRCRDRH